MTHTKTDRATAAFFGFVASCAIAGALLVAAVSASPAQFYPTPSGYGTMNNGGNIPPMTAYENGVFGNNKNGIASVTSPNAAVTTGVPSTLPSSPSGLAPVKK